MSPATGPARNWPVGLSTSRWPADHGSEKALFAIGTVRSSSSVAAFADAGRRLAPGAQGGSGRAAVRGVAESAEGVAGLAAVDVYRVVPGVRAGSGAEAVPAVPGPGRRQSAGGPRAFDGTRDWLRGASGRLVPGPGVCRSAGVPAARRPAVRSAGRGFRLGACAVRKKEESIRIAQRGLQLADSMLALRGRRDGRQPGFARLFLLRSCGVPVAGSAARPTGRREGGNHERSQSQSC